MSQNTSIMLMEKESRVNVDHVVCPARKIL